MAGMVKWRGSRWYGVYRQDGKQKWVALSANIKESQKTKAQRELDELIVADRKGEVAQDNRMTVAELIAQWMKFRTESGVSMRSTTQADYESKIRVHINPHLGHMRIADVRLRDIEQFYAKILRSKRNPKGLQGQSMKPIHAILKQSFDMAVRWESIPRSPMDKVRRPDGESKQKTVLDADQFRRLTAELAGTPLAVPALVLGMTGMRRGELLALRWSNVDMENRTVQVNDNLVKPKGKALEVGMPKSATSQRQIPLPSAVIDALLIHRVEQEKRKGEYRSAWIERDLVFPHTDGDFWRPSTFSAAFANAAKIAGFPITPHSLRHGYASILFDSDVDMKTIQELLGHATLDITMDLYTTLFERRKRAAVDKLDAAFAPREEGDDKGPRVIQ